MPNRPMRPYQALICAIKAHWRQWTRGRTAWSAEEGARNRYIPSDIVSSRLLHRHWALFLIRARLKLELDQVIRSPRHLDRIRPLSLAHLYIVTMQRHRNCSVTRLISVWASARTASTLDLALRLHSLPRLSTCHTHYSRSRHRSLRFMSA